MKRTSLLAVAMIGSLTACASTQVRSDWDRNASFAQYRTFAWVETAQTAAMQHASLVDRRLRASVDQELAAKGMQKAPDPNAADVLLVYRAGVERKLDVQDWGRFGRNVDVRQYKEGMLVLDMVDARSLTLVWRGTAAGELRGSDPSAKEIDATVKRMFKDFPTT